MTYIHIDPADVAAVIAERDDLRQQVQTLTAQVAQRDEQIAAIMDELTHKRQDWALAETERAALRKSNAALSDENVTLLRALKAAQSALDALIDTAIDEAFDMVRNDVRTAITTAEELPFEQQPAPDSGDAPADLSMLGGLEAIDKMEDERVCCFCQRTAEQVGTAIANFNGSLICVDCYLSRQAAIEDAR